MQLVLVEWVDSHSNHRWQSLDEHKRDCNPLNCRTVGWLLEKKNGHVVIVSSLAGEDNDEINTSATGDLTIPMSAITKLTVLRKNL